MGQKLVLEVVRAEKSRREIDLSLRQVTNEERRNKLIEWKQREKAMTILSMVKKKLEMDDRQYSEVLTKLQGGYGTFYEALEDAAKRGEKTFATMASAPRYRKRVGHRRQRENRVAEVRGRQYSGDEL